jgi:multimeric flavodoxin WrbA
MRIAGICCSPREGKTTRYALDYCLAAITKEYPQVNTVTIDLAGKNIMPCKACGQCLKSLKCSQEDDFGKLIPLLASPDIGGLIIATPVYLGAMSAQCKAFMDRTVMFRRNGFLFKDKVGGIIAVGAFRGGGQEAVIQSLHAVLLVHDMIVVGDGKPGAHLGGTMWSGHPKGIEQDTEGLETAQSLGRRVTEVALKIMGEK